MSNHKASDFISVFLMTDAAKCYFDNCEGCASRTISRSELTEFCCEGGFDLHDSTYVYPCEVCMQRLAPATQDHDDYYLKTYLAQLDLSVEEDLGSLIFGDHQAEHVFNDILQEQKHAWPNVRLPTVAERVVEENGVSRTFRFYKPFQRIQPDEEVDFKNFLEMIF